MYQLALDKICELSKRPQPKAAWLAGRILLARMLLSYPLPEIVYDPKGKPGFGDKVPLWFNISHCGDNIALLISDEGEVGCDVEVMRPCHWQRVADAVFSPGELQLIEKEPEGNQLATFWRIWTCKEAMVKQCGDSVSQIMSVDSTHPGRLYLNHRYFGALSVAVCTLTPFSF